MNNKDSNLIKSGVKLTSPTITPTSVVAIVKFFILFLVNKFLEGSVDLKSTKNSYQNSTFRPIQSRILIFGSK